MAIPERAPTAAQGWVLYDGECSLCTGMARRNENLLHRHGFELATLQTGWVCRQFGFDPRTQPEEMIVILPDGEAMGGADGVMQIARRIWWAWPVFALAQVPGMMILFRAIYRQIAASRSCNGEACGAPPRSHPGDWLLLILLPVLTLAARPLFPAWVFMWLLAGSLYFGCKWLTWRRGLRQVGRVDRYISMGYLFGWVGMDAKSFLRPKLTNSKTTSSSWYLAVLKILSGVALIWLVTPCLIETRPVMAGWIGMLGVILCLHFGLFQLLAFTWQRAGVDAVPLMLQPLRSVSLAEFWGRRWNGAFHQLATDLLFRPLLRRCGVVGTTLIVFLVSGLIHDLLISVPARGGYGLPTAYFLIQGLGVIFERTKLARKMGLGCGWRGWMFTAVCVAAPVCWLFHPLFIQNIILPMLHAIGT
jgi:predicted DCC family thiol-disulfide oxidoreductase YuxK